MRFMSRTRTAETRRTRKAHLTTSSSDGVFRRSRTITGSQSATVSSVAERNSHIQSPRHHIQELRIHRRRIGISLVASLLIAGTLFWLLDHYIAAPRVVTTTSTSASTDIYSASVTKYFDTHPFERLDNVLRQANFLSTLQQQHPEIASATIHNDAGFVTHTVTLTFRQPIAIWQLGDTRYYVDRHGVLFEVYRGNEPTLHVKDESGLPVATQKVASKSLMEFIGYTVGEIHRQQVGEIAEVILPRGTLREVDIMMRGRSYRIKLSLDRDVSQQVSDMMHALRYVDNQRITPLYLDVRVEGRAYYLE